MLTNVNRGRQVLCPMSMLIFFSIFSRLYGPDDLCYVTQLNYNQAITNTITPKGILLPLLYMFGVEMFSVYPKFQVGKYLLLYTELQPSDFFIEDSTHVMTKVMLPIISLRNHNSKIAGASSMLCQLSCNVEFHLMKCNISR